jgi:DNA primase
MLEKEEIQILRDISIHKILKIQNTGSPVKILCPFHNEKTASFTLYPDNGYKCYGCNKSGNGSIDFLVDMGCSFSQAVEELVQYL